MSDDVINKIVIVAILAFADYEKQIDAQKPGILNFPRFLLQGTKAKSNRRRSTFSLRLARIKQNFSGSIGRQWVNDDQESRTTLHSANGTIE